MNLSLFQIDVIHRKRKRFTDPDACPQKKKDKRPVPCVIDDREELFNILGVHGSGEDIGDLQLDPSLEKGCRDDILLHEEVEKGNDRRHPRPHRRDIHTPVLLMFDEGLKVVPCDLGDSRFCPTFHKTQGKT